MSCPNALHNHPLPSGYCAGSDEADARLSAQWKNLRCPDCGLFGWEPPSRSTSSRKMDMESETITGHQHCASCPHEWCPKMLREKLCAQEAHIPRSNTVLEQRTRQAFTALIDVLDKHRPLGSDGKHGARHTNTCGCDLT